MSHGLEIELPEGWHLDPDTIRNLQTMTSRERRYVAHVWRDAQAIYDQLQEAP